ncbi:MAG: hypothetical protein WAX85_00225 [Minisyncoccia bacterium]
MKENKIYIIAIGIFLIGVLIGLGIGLSVNEKQTGGNFNFVSQAGLPEVAKEKQVKVARGIITQISGNTITLKADSSSGTIPDQPDTQEINVTSSTKIIQQVQKSPAEYQKELEKQGKNAGTLPIGSVMPMPFTEKTITLSDLKVKDLIAAQSDQKSKTAGKFEASNITVFIK